MLTGSWQGNEGGVFYIRHVGDCVWWFGTAVDDGARGHFGFASIAGGRLVGTQLDLEWADVPLGNILGAGGLTFVYDQTGDRLTLTKQRSDWEPFGLLVVDQGNSKVADWARARISSIVSSGVSDRYIASMITIEPSTSTIQKSSIWPGPW